MSIYLVREDGKNGSVEVFENRLVKTKKKLMGKDDVQTIPLKAITGVTHDRKKLSTDEVTVYAGMQTYTWKVAKQADVMVAELNDLILAL